MKPFLFFVAALVALFIGAGMLTGDKPASAPADSLSEEGRRAVAQFEAEQWVKLSAENHKGYIKSEMWRSVNAERKELVTVMLARECARRRGDESLNFELFDEHTGKRLATYGSWDGFKVE